MTINPTLPAIVAFRTLACGRLAVIVFDETHPLYEGDFDRTGPCAPTYFLTVGKYQYTIPKEDLSEVLANVELYEHREVPRWLRNIANLRLAAQMGEVE
jgi:hypothetical protein